MRDRLQDIMKERGLQDEKWGVQDHDDERWLAILVEEVGEAAQAVLENSEFNHVLVIELASVAAVALAWLESIDRRAE